MSLQVNVLSEEFSGELVEVRHEVEQMLCIAQDVVQVMEDSLANPEAKSAVLVSSKPGCFIAGADIAWLDSAKDEEEVKREPFTYSTVASCNPQCTLPKAPSDFDQWASNDAEA